MNGKWVKSQKVVDFPVKGFDPTLYLASVPKETVLRHREISNDTQSGIKVKIKNDQCICNSNNVIKTDSNCNYDECEAVLSDSLPKITKRDRLESTSLMTTPIEDASLQDFHQHRLVPGANPFDLKYNLYSVVVSYRATRLFGLMFEVRNATFIVVSSVIPECLEEGIMYRMRVILAESGTVTMILVVSKCLNRKWTFLPRICFFTKEKVNI